MFKKLITSLVIFTVLISCTNTNSENSTSVISDSSSASKEIIQENTTNNEEDGILLVAQKLGVDAEELKAALGDPSNGAPDFNEAANILNIDSDLLESTMMEMMGNQEPTVEIEPYDVEINGITFNIAYELFTWDSIPEDVELESMGIEEFTNEDGINHYYEFFYLPSGNLNWYQVATLAEEAGGYLVCPTSEEENTFIFSHFDDEKYFWYFDADGDHYGISIGPFLGGYQPVGSAEPDGGWSWLSGETWDWSNWAQNLDDGIIDQDPRDNTQPNDSGDGQPIMGYGELNEPVPTWGDYMDSIGTYGSNKLPGRSFGFTIEYETYPTNR